jgi:L-malate glycosyltransferase
MQVHQFLPTLTAGDAISAHTLRIQRALRDAGHESELFVDDIHEPMRGKGRPFADYERVRRDGAWILFHASTGSVLTDYVIAQGPRLLIDYHNITPARFFWRWEPDAARNMEVAREELRRLRPHTRFAIADSTYNEDELRAEGFDRTAVCPILVDFSDYDRPPRERTVTRLRKEAAGGCRWIFVGRLSPNKCQHDVIAAFAVYRKVFDPGARLSLIGGGPAPLYRKALAALASELGVAEAVELTDAIDHPDASTSPCWRRCTSACRWSRTQGRR